MKKELRKEIRTSSSQALQEMLDREREKVRVFRFRVAQGKTKNVKERRESRKIIARILTRMHAAKQNS
ncbi:MAG: 50S ribosomal protein L29 [Candidatus Niyogibacteria bacterium]|nr:50S ribosomal protein L29 [Candidatus Niyogibacteria bacterium]